MHHHWEFIRLTHIIRTGWVNVHHLHAGETKSPHCSVSSIRHQSILSLMLLHLCGRQKELKPSSDSGADGPRNNRIDTPTSENQRQANSSGFGQRVLYLSCPEEELCTLETGLLPKVYPPPCKTPTAQPKSMALVGFRCHQVASEDLLP